MKIISVSSLSLHNFRNYEQARIEVSPAPVVLFGHNGAGKTNFLEALSLLLPGRGLRRARMTDFMPAHADNKNWAVVAAVNGLQGDSVIATGRDIESVEQEKRALKIDGKNVKTQSELAKHLSLIWLTPQMEQLFLAGASEGRKFIDRLVYSFSPEHASHVNAYEQAMRERNRLLSEGNSDNYWLLALEKTMAQKAAIIASERISTIEHINYAIEKSNHSFPKPHLAMRGIIEDILANEKKDALFAESYFLDILSDARLRDKEAGRALSGVHRSELIVMHREKKIPAERCSTGEQKALLLSIILAKCRAVSYWKSVIPMILLDEVVAHLDYAKRFELFDEICDSKAQTWMTGTDRLLFAGMEGKAQFFEVKNNALTIAN